jgi:hypothetical protein
MVVHIVRCEYNLREWGHVAALEYIFVTYIFTVLIYIYIYIYSVYTFLGAEIAQSV